MLQSPSMNAKQAILDSHTDEGLDSARTERTVFTERTADLDGPPPKLTAAPDVLATRGLTDEDLQVSGLPPAPGTTPASGTDDPAPDKTGDLALVLDGTVSDVTAYMDAHPEQAEQLRNLELSGQARKGVLEHVPAG